MKTLRPLIEEGLARRNDGKRFEDLSIQGAVTVVIDNDVKAAIDRAKPPLAFYVGGMGHRDKNFHAMAMTRAGYGDAAKRVQELFLAGRRDEATAALPDEYVDDRCLIGPPARIRERWKAWADSGLTGITVGRGSYDAMELMADVAREWATA
jgi:alkanesulfonate monooxygenase SsuD/methylene tetrahydromethanopterin reductase-like flavin-dependent oxidoreductase (luciferase family)